MPVKHNFNPSTPLSAEGVLATKALLLAVLLAAPFAVRVGGGGAAWSSADPKCTVLQAEASLVGSVALAIWYWADPKRTMLLA